MSLFSACNYLCFNVIVKTFRASFCFSNSDCFPPVTAQFYIFFWHRDAFMHSNDDSFFPSWLNATTKSMNMFLSVPVGCLVWHEMHLTHLSIINPLVV